MEYSLNIRHWDINSVLCPTFTLNVVTTSSKDGLSATAKVTGEDEWLCEAYMKTDYTTLREDDFQQTLNNYLAYLLKEGKIYES